jgi:hypothetical protein
MLIDGFSWCVPCKDALVVKLFAVPKQTALEGTDHWPAG